MYDAHPPRAIHETRRLIRNSEGILLNYLTINRDIYGYEVKRFLGNVTILIEGAIRSERGSRTGEYSAKLVYNHNRWRILDLDIDPI